ncbi:CapA family protein [Faecalimonas umbilicata]|nr:CapA family protein [Faecalimonas umbilicata]
MNQQTDDERRERERIRRRRAARRRQIVLRRRLMLAGATLLMVIILGGVIRNALADSSKNESKSESAKKVTIDPEEQESSKEVEEATATLFTAGDIIMHKPFLTSPAYYKEDGTYDYNPIFTYVKSYLESADFAVTTLECALTDGDYSGYPTFHSPDAIAEALAANGVDMCLLANNHIYDNGDEGLQRTMDVMTQNSLLYAGTRKTTSDKTYTIQDIGGIKVGFFNYVFETEEVNGQKTINGIAVTDESAPLINSFQSNDLESFYREIETGLEEMEAEGVEFTVAYMHWGIEYQTEESEEQDAMAQRLCDMGIDALIGSHPHVIQPVDLLESADGNHQMLCAYAIGNHLSNQRTEYMDGLAYGHTEDGLMLSLTLHRDKEGQVSIEKADFIPTWVSLTNNNGAEYYILPLNEPDKLEEMTGLSVAADAQESLARTNAIISEGVNKVQQALPLK